MLIPVSFLGRCDNFCNNLITANHEVTWRRENYTEIALNVNVLKIDGMSISIYLGVVTNLFRRKRLLVFLWGIYHFDEIYLDGCTLRSPVRICHCYFYMITIVISRWLIAPLLHSTRTAPKILNLWRYASVVRHRFLYISLLCTLLPCYFLACCISRKLFLYKTAVWQTQPPMIVGYDFIQTFRLHSIRRLSQQIFWWSSSRCLTIHCSSRMEPKRLFDGFWVDWTPRLSSQRQSQCNINMSIGIFAAFHSQP